MASATPLVVTAVGALPEVVGPDGLAALHVPPGDSQAMAEAMLRLLHDPDLRDRLGAAGRARVEAGLSWESAARTAVAWYSEHRDALRHAQASSTPR
jgi:glycosyltransferase involved in cell wall biosynthesis